MNNTALRVVSAVVLAPIALAAAWFGEWPFACLAAAAGIAVFWEWIAMVSGPGHRLVFSVGAGALVIAAIVAERGRPAVAAMLVALGALAVAIFTPGERRGWATAGVGYAGVMLLAPLVLRNDPQWGFSAIVLLFAIVWTTDILGYFAGRAFGGPKLAPVISPNKTWSGAVAGLIGAAVVAALSAMIVPFGNVVVIAIGAMALSAFSQAGDLFESALKRAFGVKDSSNLIPGHGGVMDRLDGFWAAALLGVLIGVLRGGFESPARGLLVW